jgi:hypothetical protein
MLAASITSCGDFKNMQRAWGKSLEGSVDLSEHRYSGDSYDESESADADVGINIAFIMLMPVAPKTTKPTSFNLPTREYRYELAYASESSRTERSGLKEYRFLPSLATEPSDRFIDHLNILTGLEFVQKNSKYEEVKTRLNYFQIPVVAMYLHDLGNDRKVFGGLGPYFAFGVGGKIKGNGFSEKAFDEEFGYKRFDAGLTFTGGYSFNNQWSVRLAYDLGLANLEQESFDKTKNRCLSLSVGYSLNKLFDKIGEK